MTIRWKLQLVPILSCAWVLGLAALAAGPPQGGAEPAGPQPEATFYINAGDVTGLITAINTANENLDASNIIQLGGGNYILETVNGVMWGPTGLPAITKNLTIEGNGSTIARDGAAPNFRIFTIASGAALTLRNLTLTGGLTQGGAGGAGQEAGGGGAGMGGAIFNQGALTLENCTLTGNTATGGAGGTANSDHYGGGGGGVGGSGGNAGNGGGGGGGGWMGNGGNGNHGGGGGGGTYVAPTGNGGSGSSCAGGAGGYFTGGAGGSGDGAAGGVGGGGGGGAGFYSGVSGGRGGFGGGAAGGGYVAPRSAFGGGWSQGGCSGGGGAALGGAIFNHGGTVTLTNSTLYGNNVIQGYGGDKGTCWTMASNGSAIGGGLFSRNGTVTIAGCTIFGNWGGVGLYVVGDGATATLALTDTILARNPNGNSDFQADGINGGAASVSGNYNLIERPGNFSGGYIGGNPLLGPLADNGGPTFTCAPSMAPRSPALGAGGPRGGLLTDQRGVARPADCIDIGAYQALALGPPASIGVTSGSGQSAAVGSVFASPLVATVWDAGGNALPCTTVTFTAPAAGATCAWGGSTSTTVTTNSYGVATAPAPTAINTCGGYAVSATVAGVGTPATFTLTNPMVLSSAPSPLPGGVAGTPYSASIVTSGGTPAYNFSVTSGALPPGLTLDPSGLLHGTPTTVAGSPFGFTVTCADAGGCTGSTGFSIAVTCPAIAVLNPATSTGWVNWPFSGSFSQTGGNNPTQYSTASALPSGITLAPDGTLSGTPTVRGTFPIAVKATDSATCTGTGPDYTLSIYCQWIDVSPSSLLSGAVGVAYAPVTFSQTGGVGAIAWSESGPLPPGMSFAAGTLSGTPTVLGTFHIAVTATDQNGCTGSQNLTLTINCAEVSPANASYPARLVKSSGSSTEYYLYFQRVDGAEGYNVYEGSTETYYSHGSTPGNVCNVAATDLGSGEMRAEITPSPGNRYYLVTGYANGAEGPSGFSSGNVEIPPSQSTCAP